MFGLLTAHHVHQIAVVREHSSQHLVEHHAQAVPVISGAGRAANPLLRRHVLGRAHHRVKAVLTGTRVADQTEVQDDHPAVFRHQDVAGLQAPVYHAEAVQP